MHFIINILSEAKKFLLPPPLLTAGEGVLNRAASPSFFSFQQQGPNEQWAKRTLALSKLEFRRSNLERRLVHHYFASRLFKFQAASSQADEIRNALLRICNLSQSLTNSSAFIESLLSLGKEK